MSESGSLFGWLIAAILMAANGFLGGYGHYIRKKKPSAWLYMHRSIAVLAVLAEE